MFFRRATILMLALLALAGVTYFLVKGWPANVPIEVLRSDLELRDQRLYLKGQSDPFNGVMLEHYPGNLIKSRSEIREGKLHGTSEGWFTNGQIQVREIFNEGVSDGPRFKWFENGTNQSEAMIAGGQLQGKFRKYHENGSLAEEMTMKEGQPDGVAVSYFPSGFLKGAARFENQKMVAQQFWTDGERNELPATIQGK